MQSREAEIQQLHEAVAACEKQIDKEFYELGQKLLSLSPSSIPPELLPQFDRAQILQESCEKIRQDRTHISGRMDRLAEIRQLLREADKAEKVACHTMEKNYPELARLSYELYLSSPKDRDTYRGLFQPLLDIDEEIQRARQSMTEIDSASRSGGLFRKAFGAGKKATVRLELVRIEQHRSKSLFEVGQRIPASGFGKGASDQELSRLLSVMDTEHRLVVSLEDKRQSLLGEQSQIGRELEAYGVQGTSAQRRLGDLDKEAENTLQELGLVAAQLGEVYVEKNLRQTVATDEIRSHDHGIRQLRQTIRAKEREIEKMRALAETEKLAAKKAQLEERRTKLIGEVRERQEEVETLQAEIESILRRISEFQRIAESPLESPEDNRMGAA